MTKNLTSENMMVLKTIASSHCKDMLKGLIATILHLQESLLTTG
jgi:hypothetical protein